MEEVQEEVEEVEECWSGVGGEGAGVGSIPDKYWWVFTLSFGVQNLTSNGEKLEIINVIDHRRRQDSLKYFK